MAAGDGQATEGHRQRAAGNGSRLEPFEGSFIPGLCFESGHCIWLLHMASTPTAFDAYTEWWLVTPDAERLLYVDPGEAAEEVRKYHDFDWIGAGSIDVARTASRLELDLTADDGTEMQVACDLADTVGTRLLTGVIRVTPDAILGSSVGTAVSTLSLNLLTDARGLRVAGRTETERRYRLAPRRIRSITGASATLDGSELGARSPPDRPIEFGDAKTTGEPLFVPGTLYLERQV